MSNINPAEMHDEPEARSKIRWVRRLKASQTKYTSSADYERTCLPYAKVPLEANPETFQQASDALELLTGVRLLISTV